MHTRWSRFRSKLPELNQLAIPRRVKFSADPKDVQIHGFCDASQRAYGLYIHSNQNRLRRIPCWITQFKITGSSFEDGFTSTIGVISCITTSSFNNEVIKRASSNAADSMIKTAINTANIPVYMWSDSTITFNWISSPSRKWATFVANRVGEI